MMMPPFGRDLTGQGALSGRIFYGNDLPTALPWAGSELPLVGASDSAEVLTGFLKNAEGLIHSVAFANHPETSEKWYYSAAFKNLRGVAPNQTPRREALFFQSMATPWDSVSQKDGALFGFRRGPQPTQPISKRGVITGRSCAFCFIIDRSPESCHGLWGILFLRAETPVMVGSWYEGGVGGGGGRGWWEGVVGGGGQMAGGISKLLNGWRWFTRWREGNTGRLSRGRGWGQAGSGLGWPWRGRRAARS
jgi:hypothetical protein